MDEAIIGLLHELQSERRRGGEIPETIKQLVRVEDRLELVSKMFQDLTERDSALNLRLKKVEALVFPVSTDRAASNARPTPPEQPKPSLAGVDITALANGGASPEVVDLIRRLQSFEADVVGETRNMFEILNRGGEGASHDGVRRSIEDLRGLLDSSTRVDEDGEG